MKFEDKFKKILSEILENHKSLFLVELAFSSKNDIKVLLDGDEGVTLRDCTSINSEIKKN